MTMATITGFSTADVRFPTSRLLDGSDAMNPDPDYSAAYLVLTTDAQDGLEGHGLVFTIGRGNEIQVAALEAFREHVLGRDVVATLADLGGMSRELLGDSQLRWLGPEKGPVHMAIGAIMNALWDLRAKRAGLPLWQLLGQLPSEEIVDLVDFRYLTDALTPREARSMLRALEDTRAVRVAQLLDSGYPAYTTGPGWLGYDDEKLARLCAEARDSGYRQIKLKVGANIDDDVRRLSIARRVLGPDFPIAIDANQRWDVAEAIHWVNELAVFNPAWIEEPTSPDDILAHRAIRAGITPVPVATGEHGMNRVLFKQLLQAEAVDVVQIDATRTSGINENIAILLLAAKFGKRVCPHAGGVGLCEMVQHLAMFDFVAVSGTRDGRMIEHVDHLHEHFVAPVEVTHGAFAAPRVPGAGAEMYPGSVRGYAFPLGAEWVGTNELLL
jgi:L-fuconate dehydratase